MWTVQTTNLIINLDHDEWILDDDSQLLVDLGLGKYFGNVIGHSDDDSENETEVSFFHKELYTQFKANPQVRLRSFTAFSN
jgi:hypothetical protein